jgi:ribosomal protein RSM22 (predicted rRNA methylase)
MRWEFGSFHEQQKCWRQQPRTNPRVLDIGAGIGFAVAALNGTLPGVPNYTLLDYDLKTHTNVLYNFTREGLSAYNNFEATRVFLDLWGVPLSRCRLVEASTHRAHAFDRVYDLVISILSWGWHYPIDTYLDQVLASTSPGSLLRVDLRAGTDGREKLLPHFQLIWAQTTSKGEMTAWVRE